MEQTRQWMAGQWLDEGALAPLAELNSQCLELVVALAAAPGASSLQRQVGLRLAALSPEARAGLAASPWLLADAGFDQPGRWQHLARWRVQDVPREDEPGVFCAAGAASFVRSVFVYGWHLARAHGQLARIVLGMTPACARSVAALGLADLHWASDHRPGWVSMRWENRPQLWRSLLAVAEHGDRIAVQRASLRGIQLLGAMAMERRGA